GHLDTERLRGIFTHRVRTLEQDFFELTTGPGSAHWTPLLAVSPYLMHAVIKQEDSSFAWNSGFAVFAIRDALIKNIRLGRFAYGASTITMQLAKNIFLHRDKTLVRKFQELFFAWYLNSELEKSEVLELYLNVVEFGPSIYGVRQASLHYFGVEPRDLSPAEACFLAAVLPAPTTYHQQWEDGVLSLSMKKKIRRMLQRLIKSERIDQAAHDFGVNELEDPMFFRSLEESALPEEQSQFAGHGHLNRLWSDEPSPSGQSTSSRELIQRVETEQVERPWIGEARPLPFLSPSVPLETEASERESYRTGE
ncbi:MAG: biosynthetic peptidoglycan transglycosylase, partial [Myxococcota bacterium]